MHQMRVWSHGGGSALPTPGSAPVDETRGLGGMARPSAFTFTALRPNAWFQEEAQSEKVTVGDLEDFEA